jgi:GNAT superfamily N-acetyltransferase
MLAATDLIKASIKVGRDFLRPPQKGSDNGAAKRATPLLIPIRSLGANHRARIAQHLLSLSAQDRYLRFGYLAQDEHIQRYVDGLDFDRDEIFGIYNRKLDLIAMAHLAHAAEKNQQACAEFGVSVLSSARGRGYGARLFERAAMHAANDGISLLFIHALSENAAMLKIARNAGARVERDGSESEAFLHLPPSTFDSQVTEMIEEQVAQTDYRIKAQAKQFWSFLAEVQEVRRDTIDAQRRSSP